MHRFRRLLASLACVVVGVASFALSYVALRDEASRVGAVPGYLAWLVPVVIDGGVICGSAIIWSLSKEEGKRPVFPFLFVGVLVAVSVVVNVAHAGAPVLAKGIASLPPLILLGTLELVAAQGRRELFSSSEEGAEVEVEELRGELALAQGEVERLRSTAGRGLDPAVSAQTSTTGGGAGASVHLLSLPTQRIEGPSAHGLVVQESAPVVQEGRVQVAAKTRRTPRPAESAGSVPGASGEDEGQGRPRVVRSTAKPKALASRVVEDGVDEEAGPSTDEGSRPRRTTRKALRVSAEEPEPLPA